jgi:hypothetical protein
MTIRSTVHAANTHVSNLAFDPIPIPGLSDKLNTFGGWVMSLSYLATGVAILIGGGYLAWDKITDHGGGKGVKIAVGAIIGTAVISSAGSIITAAQ